MEAAGLALGAYKDVYFLVMSIYRLGMSAHHYEKDKAWLLTQLHGEYLYLRTFIYVFSALLKKQRAPTDHDGPQQIFIQIHDVVKHLEAELSDYKIYAYQKDEQYRDQCAKFTEATRYPLPADLEEIHLKMLPPPMPVTTAELKRRDGIVASKMRGIRSVFSRKEPAWKAEAWTWALFDRRKLEVTLTKFQEHNQMLTKFEFCIMAVLSPEVKGELGTAIKRDLPSDSYQSSFVTHANITALVESTNYSQDPAGQIGPPSLSADTKAIETSETPSLQQMAVHSATITERKACIPNADSKRGITVAMLTQLAFLLWEAGANGLHTLPLKSVTRNSTSSEFAFEFGYPVGTSETEPVSLKDLIESEQSSDRLSLPLRFHIALTVSLAIGAFHADGWLHKSLRSDSIKFFFTEQNSSCIYRDPYLVDFEYSRPEAAATILASDNNLQRNLYRHPDRQGLPTAKFNKIHDVYSLGVVLLEIGVWQTAESMREDYLEDHDLRDTGKVSSEMRDMFLEKAEESLGHTMGQAYQEAVKACISGELDGFLNTSNFALKFQEAVIRNIDAERVGEIDY
ncbi:HET-s/LopB domain protein [Pestalotiopsis sp. NC0098]|nr:HET-s/LopB domain protein [Pestalotiopsis sp. NC0098]